ERSVVDGYRQERQRIHARHSEVSGPVQVWASGAACRTDDTKLLTALDHRSLRNVDAIEVEIERIESEAVIEHDEPAGEEEVSDQRDTSTVRRDDGRAALGTEVHA